MLIWRRIWKEEEEEEEGEGKEEEEEEEEKGKKKKERRDPRNYFHASRGDYFSPFVLEPEKTKKKNIN